jgi:soluble lytic murein transglycosylase-like protein
LAAAALVAAAPVAAQTYRSPLSAFSIGGSQLSHAAPDPHWERIAFPARTNRRYKRAPRQAGLEQRRQSCEPHFAEAAKLYKLPVDFIRAVAHVESSFYTNALSVDGAMGVMQLMPFTARKMGVTRPEDARQNVLGGARFLRILANQWSGNIVLTVASYNAGAGAVKKYGGVPPYAETQRYVQRVLARFHAYALEHAEREHRASEHPPVERPLPANAAGAVACLYPSTEQKGPNHEIRRP